MKGAELRSLVRARERGRGLLIAFEGPDGAVLAASGPQGETDARARVHVPMLVAEERVGSLVTVERTAGCVAVIPPVVR